MKVLKGVEGRGAGLGVANKDGRGAYNLKN